VQGTAHAFGACDPATFLAGCSEAIDCPGRLSHLSCPNDPFGQPSGITASPAQIDTFIVRWQGREGGQERANYALFPTELCDVLGVPRPDPAAAHTAGNVRWLSPDYQVPRFGSAKDKLALTGGAMREPAVAAAAGPKPSFPTSELEQTAAVLSVLTSIAAPISPTALAARFRQGRRVLPQVEAVLAALLRVGGLVYSPDGGRTFAPRRAA
jgi:hypothetical protein